MAGNTPNKTEFLRRLSTSARKRDFEFAVSQWEQRVINGYDEVDEDPEHGQHDVAGVSRDRANRDGDPPRGPGTLSTDIQTLDSRPSDKSMAVDVDVRPPKRKRNGETTVHVFPATTIQPPGPETTRSTTDSLDQRHIPDLPRVVKDITSTPEREQSLFYYGTNKSPAGKATGIFSPRLVSTPEKQEAPPPVLLKERYVYGSNKRKLSSNSEERELEGQSNDLDRNMPFTIFGWSPSRKNASANSSANSTPDSSRKKSTDIKTHPQGVRLTTFSAKLKALRIENINKRSLQQNGDTDANLDNTAAPPESNTQDSLPNPEGKVIRPRDKLPTDGTIGNHSSGEEHTMSNDPLSSDNLPRRGLEPADTELGGQAHTQAYEADQHSGESCPDLTIEFANAYVTDITMGEYELPSGSSRAGPADTGAQNPRPTKFPNFEGGRGIPLLDKHDIARAEEMAARAVIAKYTPPTPKIGNFSFGGQVTAKEREAKLKALRNDFNLYINNLDATSLERDHTIAAWKRGWNEHLADSGSALVKINRQQDIEAYLKTLAEAEGDLDETTKEFLRFMNRDQIDMDEFMAQMDEEEDRSKQRYLQRNGQPSQAPGPIPNRPWPHLPCTLGWEPVKTGWVSYDGKYECIEAGAIPKFAYREEQIQEPEAPKTVWSGAMGSDDEIINEEISYKLLGLEENWKESPTGMYLGRIDDKNGDDSDTDEEDIGWSSRLLNHRLMLTCNSVNGSNVDLSYDPEELDIPTMDTNRHFAKMDCTLTLQYPNYVKTERKFNRMGEMVTISPPVRKDKIPRKSCMKPLEPDSPKNQGRPRVVARKRVKFRLTHEERSISDSFHPRQSSWSQKKQYLLRKAFRQHGLFEMLPSVRAQHTRIRGFEHYYPRFLQPPPRTQVRQTGSYGAGYILNHIARFKLGLPTLEDGRTRAKIRDSLSKLVEHRKNGLTRHRQNKYNGFLYKLPGRVFQQGRRRIRHPNYLLEQEPRLVAAFQTRTRERGAYMVYWRASKERNTDDKEDGDWVDLSDEGYVSEENSGD
ncbi:hypothetical protein TWF718_001256 [Orbilia javanica]|uniref:Uncharacterized protein n=1 Tax=Orbilia javanica TaxID=47235 RepID=A0AAN8MYE7_9PEZI